jgi:hypothetical protein
MLLIKKKLIRRVDQDETCPNIGRDNSTADYRVILFTAAVKLPCGLEQLEKLAGGSPMLGIRRNGNHISSVITGMRSPPR